MLFKRALPDDLPRHDLDRMQDESGVSEGSSQSAVHVPSIQGRVEETVRQQKVRVVMIRQVCILSTARPVEGALDVQNILTQARANNGLQGITGMLAAGGGFYLQIIEGEAAAVAALIQRLEADQRHENLRILQDIEVAERDFCGCPMAFRSLAPEAVGLISAHLRRDWLPGREIAAAVGNPAAAATLSRMPLAA